MHRQNEQNLRILKAWIPEATMENLQDLQKCLNEDAVYKCGLPVGVTSAAVSYFMIPKRFGATKSLIASGVGFFSYLVGKMSYGSSVCQEKVFGPLLRKRNLPDDSNYVDGTTQENDQNRLVISSDKLLDDDSSSWNNFDTYQDSHMSHFDSIDNSFQEELPVEQPTEVKRNVTYDDLWAQHREPEKEELRRGWRHTYREAPTITRQTSEKLPPPKTTFDEENIWS